LGPRHKPLQLRECGASNEAKPSLGGCEGGRRNPNK